MDSQRSTRCLHNGATTTCPTDTHYACTYSGEVCTSSSPATVSYSMYCTLRTHLGPSETQKLIPCATSVSQVDKKSCTALPEHHCRLIDTEWGTYARTARIRGPWRCVILANLRASHVSDKNFVHYSCCMYYSTFL